MTFQVADKQMYDQVIALYARVIESLSRDNINIYWDLETYPSRAYFSQAIEAGELFVALDGQRVIAAAVLDHKARPEYADVPFGVSASDDQVRLMHVLGVSPEVRGRGVATFMLEQMKELCRARGFLALRLDALLCNAPACALYRRAGLVPVARQTFLIPDVGPHPFEVFEYVVSENVNRKENCML